MAGEKPGTTQVVSRYAKFKEVLPLKDFLIRSETMMADPDADFLIKYGLLQQNRSNSDDFYLHLLILKVFSSV